MRRTGREGREIGEYFSYRSRVSVAAASFEQFEPLLAVSGAIMEHSVWFAESRRYLCADCSENFPSLCLSSWNLEIGDEIDL